MTSGYIKMTTSEMPRFENGGKIMSLLFTDTDEIHTITCIGGGE